MDDGFTMASLLAVLLAFSTLSVLVFSFWIGQRAGTNDALARAAIRSGANATAIYLIEHGRPPADGLELAQWLAETQPGYEWTADQGVQDPRTVSVAVDDERRWVTLVAGAGGGTCYFTRVVAGSGEMLRHHEDAANDGACATDLFAPDEPPVGW